LPKKRPRATEEAAGVVDANPPRVDHFQIMTRASLQPLADRACAAFPLALVLTLAACGGGGGGGNSSGGSGGAAEPSSGGASATTGGTSATTGGASTANGGAASNHAGSAGAPTTGGASGTWTGNFDSCDPPQVGVENCTGDNPDHAGTSVCTEFYSAGVAKLICGSMAASGPCARGATLYGICVAGFSTYQYAQSDGATFYSQSPHACAISGGTWCGPG
jgi:hypothetical protein